MSPILAFALLVLTASFASWALNQWLASGRGLSNNGLVLAVAGVTCLIGAAGVALYAFTQGWPLFTPRYVEVARELPQVEPPLALAIEMPAAAVLSPTEPASIDASQDSRPAISESPETSVGSAKLRAQRAFHAREYLRAAQLAEELLARSSGDVELRVLAANAYFLAAQYEDADRHIEAAIGARLDADGNPPVQWLRFQWSTATRLTNRFERARVQHALLQNYPEHRSEFTLTPDDALRVSSPPRFIVPGPLLSDWPTTECVASVRSAPGAARRMFLDNECERTVALVFASCPFSSPGCNASALVSSGWVYEAAGVVLTTPDQRPLTDRITDRGPLIAPVYPIDSQETRRRIRYLACAITDQEALAMLSAADSAADRPQRLRNALERDACYSRVLELSRSGRESGRSLDALLANG